MWQKCVLILALGSLVAGCASTQLNYNTLDLASSTDKLLTKQVLYNLSNFIQSPIAIPAQVVISAGSASTTNAINPSVSFPLSGASTLVKTAAGMVSSRTVDRNAAGASVDATDIWSQNWALQPITNPERLRRLQALYRYAVDQNEKTLVASFPLITKSVAHFRPVCVTNQVTGRCATVEDLNKRYEPGGFDTSGKLLRPTAPGAGTRDAQYLIKVPATGLSAGSASASAGTDSFSTVVPDEYFLTGPGCIVCLKAGSHASTNSTVDLRANPLLKGRWLHWRGLAGATRADTYEPNDIYLGREGHYELFVDGRRPEAFVNFVAATLAAATQSPTSGGSSTNGSFVTSGGRRGDETGLSELAAPAGQPAITIPIE